MVYAVPLRMDSRQNMSTLHCRILIEKGDRSPQSLASKSGASRRTVFRLLKAKKENLVKPQSRKGRKPCLTNADKKQLYQIAYRHPHLSFKQMAIMLEEKGAPLVSQWTIGRMVRSMGFQWKTPRRVPLLKPQHMQKRLGWCLKHRETDWSMVVFSDESKFQYFGPRNKVLTLKGKARPVAPRPSHSPSFMVWGAISLRGVTPLAIIHGSVDSVKYQDILDGHLLSTMRELYPEGFVFQQDNAPCHVSRSSKQFFKDRKFEVIGDWPANSPDLNPIENVWGWMKRQEGSKARVSAQEWRERIEKSWSSLEHDFIKNYIESMPRRIEACIAAKGGYTKY